MAKRSVMNAAQQRRHAAGMFVDDAAVLNALEKLEPNLQRTVLRSSSNKAMTPVVKDMKQAIKQHGLVNSGLLLESIGKRVKQYKRSGIILTKVGAQRGFKVLVKSKSHDGKYTSVRWQNPALYQHIVDGGRKASTRGGFMRARPFREPVLRRNMPNVIRILSREMGVGIIRQWGKLAK